MIDKSIKWTFLLLFLAFLSFFSGMEADEEASASNSNNSKSQDSGEEVERGVKSNIVEDDPNWNFDQQVSEAFKLELRKLIAEAEGKKDEDIAHLRDEADPVSVVGMKKQLGNEMAEQILQHEVDEFVSKMKPIDIQNLFASPASSILKGRSLPPLSRHSSLSSQESLDFKKAEIRAGKSEMPANQKIGPGEALPRLLGRIIPSEARVERTNSDGVLLSARNSRASVRKMQSGMRDFPSRSGGHPRVMRPGGESPYNSRARTPIREVELAHSQDHAKGVGQSGTKGSPASVQDGRKSKKKSFSSLLEMGSKCCKTIGKYCKLPSCFKTPADEHVVDQSDKKKKEKKKSQKQTQR